MAEKAKGKAEVRIKIYKDLNKGLIKFYKDVLDRYNFGSYIKFWKKGNRLYFYTASPSQGILVGENNTIQFTKPEYMAELTRFQGNYILKCDDEKSHFYYIDESCKVEEVTDTPTQRKGKRKKSDEEKFENPLQPAKDALKEIIEIKEQKGTLAEIVEQNSIQSVAFVERKPNAAENIVETTLRDLSDECLDNDDLAGAKALLKAIRRFKEMRGGVTT